MSKLYELPLAVQVTNLELHNCNYLHCLDLPSGVQAFITWDKVASYEAADEAIPITNNAKLHLQVNGAYAKPKKAYLHTIGTSASLLKLQTVSINGKSDNTLIEQDSQALELRAELTAALLLNEFTPDPTKSFKQEVLAGQTVIIDVSTLDKISFSEDDFNMFNLSLDDTDIFKAFADGEINVSLVDIIEVNNPNAGTININFWCM